jgi:hypothetical protein
MIGVAKRWASMAMVALLTASCGGGGGDAGTPPFGNGDGGTGGGGGSPTTPGGGISPVSNGVPSQRFMSISVETYNLDWSFDGITTSVQVFVADTAGNPVPNGSVIQFSTEGGQVVTSCTTSGIQNGTSTISGCSVTFNTQDYRPVDGYARIIAWMVGQEAYKDLNANGQYDQGEPFIDSGRIFRDDDDSGDYSPSFDELVVDSTTTSQPGMGTSACVLPADLPNVNEIALSVQDTCDGQWGSTLIRRTVTLPVSDPRFLSVAPAAGGVYVYSDTSFTVARPVEQRPAAPNGTVVAVANPPAECTVTVTPAAVANAVTATFHAITGVGSGCAGQTVLVSATFAGRPPATTNYTLP